MKPGGMRPGSRLVSLHPNLFPLASLFHLCESVTICGRDPLFWSPPALRPEKIIAKTTMLRVCVQMKAEGRTYWGQEKKRSAVASCLLASTQVPFFSSPVSAVRRMWNL